MLLFALVLDREFILRPVWYNEFSDGKSLEKIVDSELDNFFPVKVANFFGYIDRKGKIAFWGKKDFYTTICKNYFINYGKVSENFFIRDKVGKLESGFGAYGYPFFGRNSDRLFIVKTDLTGLSEIDFTGDVKWEKQYSSIITSMDDWNGYELVGLLDGELQLLDGNGNEIFVFKDKDTTIPVINGVAISHSGEYLASISGLEPQKLFVFKRGYGDDGEDVYSLYMQRNLSSDFRREVFIKFSNDNRFLFFEGNEGLNVLDLARRDFVVLSGGRCNIVEYSGDTHYFVSVHHPGNNEGDILSLVSPLDMIRAREYLNKNVSFLKLIENHLFIGFGDTLLRIDIERL